MIGNVISVIHVQNYCTGYRNCMDRLKYQYRPVKCCTLVFCLATSELKFIAHVQSKATNYFICALAFDVAHIQRVSVRQVLTV
jgi:hypothetical protein